jgi:N-dimethylarginine dimethylaminohydrolase
MRHPRILMCRPDHFGIEYEINPWMSREKGADPEKARRQWDGLHDTLKSLGVLVELMLPRPGLPDLVFTANAGFVFGMQFYSSLFKHEVRARESPYFDQWFESHGFTVHHVPQKLYFEGAGDALFCGQALFAGYRIRSDVRGHQYIARQIGRQVLPVELVNSRFYHLDTCFCPLAPGEALYHPEAFDSYGRKVLESNVPKLMPVVAEEAHRFGCNAVVVGKTVVTNTGCEKLAKDLKAWGYESVQVELDEFIKSGGSAKCLTLRLDGEEAAIW